MGVHKGQGHPVSEETKKKLSAARKGMSFSDEWKKNMSMANKGKHRGPMPEETRKKLSIAMTGKKRSPETLEKMSASLKGKRVGKHQSQEAREKIANYRRGRKHSPEVRAKMSESAMGIHSGELNGNWNGGITDHRYCSKFNDELKERVRSSFGRECLLCGIPENGRKLDVHHCDYNKGQGCGHAWNLIPLCRKCHMKTNGNRHYYFNLLANYWAMKYINI